MVDTFLLPLTVSDIECLNEFCEEVDVPDAVCLGWSEGDAVPLEGFWQVEGSALE